MQSQQQNMNAASKSSLLFPALFRLALLVGPEVALVKFTLVNPVICVLVAVAYLALWLSVDVGPFRASRPVAAAKTARTEPSVYRNLSKAQWVSHLFCKVIILFAMFHSKFTV